MLPVPNGDRPAHFPSDEEATLKKIFGVLVALLAATVLLAGCSSTPKEGAGVEGRGGAGAMGGEGASTAGLAGRTGGYTAADFNNPSSPLYQHIIYFDYDSSDIKPQFVDILRAHASYLSAHPSARVRLEGNTDERGTREYNLALGQQRADMVARFLTAEGVRPNQIETVSYGEERPADPGHNEAAWALNRRVMIVYLTK
jgi:peptidoglycan-associated lipoprotein